MTRLPGKKSVAAREKNDASASEMPKKRHGEKRLLRSEKAVFGGQKSLFYSFALIIQENY
jgi:hypothetical protein